MSRVSSSLLLCFIQINKSICAMLMLGNSDCAKFKNIRSKNKYFSPLGVAAGASTPLLRIHAKM